MKKLLACALALSLLLAGCAPAAQDPPAPEATLPPAEQPPTELPPAELPEEPPMAFTDSAGREVSLPQPLLHIAPGNAEAQAFLFSLTPERTAGWIAPPDLTYIGEDYRTLPILLSADGTPDWAAAANAGAQAVLLMGATMDAAALDTLQDEAGLPVLFIDSGLDTLPDAFRTLGGLLGLEEAAEERAAYLSVSSEELLEKGAAIPAEEHRRVYIASGADGLLAGDSEILMLAGAAAAMEAGGAVTPDALQELGANAVITPSADVYQRIGSDDAWQALEIVQLGFYYLAPGAPVNWLQDSTSPGQLLAAKWLYTLLYPETGYDMIGEAKLYVDTFFHYQLTDAQAQALFADSIYKTIG